MESVESIIERLHIITQLGRYRTRRRWENEEIAPGVHHVPSVASNTSSDISPTNTSHNPTTSNPTPTPAASTPSPFPQNQPSVIHLTNLLHLFTSHPHLAALLNEIKQKVTADLIHTTHETNNLLEIIRMLEARVRVSHEFREREAWGCAVLFEARVGVLERALGALVGEGEEVAVGGERLQGTQRGEGEWKSVELENGVVVDGETAHREEEDEEDEDEDEEEEEEEEEEEKNVKAADGEEVETEDEEDDYEAEIEYDEEDEMEGDEMEGVETEMVI